MSVKLEHNICRICLSTQEKMISAIIFKDEIKELTGIIISATDGLPQWLCCNCSTLVGQCVMFIKNIVKSHNMLLQNVTKGKQLKIDSRSSSPAVPPHSAPTPPKRPRAGPSRDRARSPIQFTTSGPLPSSGIVLKIYDEFGTPLEDTLDSSAGDFMDPDAHALYGSVEGMVDVSGRQSDVSVTVKRGSESDMHSRSRMVGRRRMRATRGRPVRVRCAHCQRGRCWQVGDSLEEIWAIDEAVPQVVHEMAMDIRTRPQERIKVSVAGKSTRQIHANGSKREEDDLFYDSDDGGDSSILEGKHRHFVWSPMESYRNKEESFRPRRTGSVSSYTNPYDAFRSYWDDGILQTIVDETNRRASKISLTSFKSAWYPTNSHELLCLFAFWVMSGILRMPTIDSYFSTNVLLKAEVFSRITTRARYQHLNKALHFTKIDPASDAASVTNSSDANFNRIQLVKPVIDHLNSKFQSNYVLSKDICIGKSLLLRNVRLKSVKSVGSKATTFELKTFELCESTTGYLWSFLVCTGNQSSFNLEQNMSQSAAVVQELIKPLLNKGYRLFMGNWFNSPVLARFLKRNGTDCVGILDVTRRNVPRLVKIAPLTQGQLIACHSGDVCVLSWQDKTRVTMISTCHGATEGKSTRGVPSFKPQVVLDYHQSIGGVDLKDEMLEPYLLERKRSTKWQLKLFKRLLGTSIHNAQVLLQSSSQTQQDSLNFRLELVKLILSHHHHLIPVERKSRITNVESFPHPHTVQNTHWPVSIPPTEYEASRNRRGRARCVVCVKDCKLSRTSFKCEDCDVPLCIENCFKMYHTTK